MAFKIERFISPLHIEEDPKPRTDEEILKAYPGAVKVEGKLNEFKYKGVTLNPARYPKKDKGKTVKQAIEIKNQK